MNTKSVIPAPVMVLERHLGDLAVYSGVYTAACVLSVYLLGSSRPPPLALVAAGLATTGVYLIDRVKLRDRDLDPADLAAKPRRYEYLRAHTGVFRAIALGGVVLAVTILGAQQWWLGLLPVLGAVAVLFYTRGRTPGSRLKDRVLLKNAVVAVAIVVLAGLILWSTEPAIPTGELIIILTWLGAVVLGDAALSDLDDRESDAAFGTRTLPNTLGIRNTWFIASALQLAAGLTLVAVLGVRSSTLALGLGLPITTLMLWSMGPKNVRDLIDLRLPVLAVVSIAMA